MYEIELGFKQSAYDTTAASVVRTEWFRAVRWLCPRYDCYQATTTVSVWAHEIDAKELYAAEQCLVKKGM